MSEPDAFKISEAVIDLWRCYIIERDMAKELEAENARLKAEVERLTKAHSDALADFWAIHKGYFDLKAEVERLRKAAKEGRPNE